MIHSSNHNTPSGFMLMEVLVTIAIVGMVLTPIFILQTNVLRVLYRVSGQSRLLFPVKNRLEDAFIHAPQMKQKEITEQKEITNPPGRLTYRMRKVGDASILKNVKDMYFNEVLVRSTRGERESMVGFVYKPERKKK